MRRSSNDPHLTKTGSRRNGVVMVIVLWISFGLVATALYFGHSMMLEYRSADNATGGLQAAWAIEGAREYVGYVIANLEEPAQMPLLEDYEYEAVPVGEAMFWLIGRSEGKRVFDEGPTFGLMDEASKLNINVATQEMLEMLPEMTPELAAAIIDWRDEDSELTQDGAESQNYLMRDPRYNAKDGLFETIEELRLVMGADWSVLYGEDANLNGVLDDNENDGDESFPPDNSDGTLDAGLLEYLTTWSNEPNKQDDGSDRINIKGDQASQEIQTLLQETLSEQRATEIMGAVGSNLSDINSVLEFFIRSQMTADEFGQIDNALTVTDGQYTTGLVNVNTAPAEVLACLPGIGVDFADDLVAYRQGKTETLNSVAWVAEVLDEENAIQAGPYITANTYQYLVDVAAIGRNGRGFRRVLFVIDMSEGAPTVVYRRDRSRLGWPLGQEVREQYLASGLQQGRNR